MERGPGAHPRPAGAVIALGWPGNASVFPPEEMEEVAGVREVWASLLSLLKKLIGGWMDFNIGCIT